MKKLKAFTGELTTFTNKGKELTGYPVYVRASGFAPYTHGVYQTIEQADNEADRLNRLYSEQ